MATNRVCAQCGSGELFVAARAHASLVVSILKWIAAKTVVCGDCGHIQEFVPQDKLEQVRSSLKRLN